MTTYQQEFLSMCEHEVAPLAELEWEESGHPTEGLCIDWDRYFELEEVGALKFFTARNGAELVGYIVVIAFAPLTTKGSLVGLLDSVYVAKPYRGKTGRKLFDFVETCLREDAIYRIMASSSAKKPIGAFLERMGYYEVETKFEKAL
jgi:GNAT superfamily N-acetyltransferase